MKDYVMEVLEYATVKEELKNYVVSHAAKYLIDELEPMFNGAIRSAYTGAGGQRIGSF